MTDFFKPEDFDNVAFPKSCGPAEIANAKLEKALGPTVYGNDSTPNWSQKQSDLGCLQAKLFDIQKTKKECKHETATWDFNKITGECTHCVCKDCGIKVKVSSWEPV